MTRVPVRAMICAILLVLGSRSGWIVLATQQTQTVTKNIARFEKDVIKFEKGDMERMPPKGGVVFTGSSTVKGWHENLGKDFPELKVIGRGFGGSTMPELLHYMDRLVLKYKPRAVVIYEGDNDLAAGGSVAQLVEEYKQFYKRLRKELPACRMYVLAVKPSPSRIKKWPLAKEANALLKQWCESNSNAVFLDVATPMLDAQGQPRGELFLRDKLHMNRLGYELWRDTIKAELVRNESGMKTAQLQAK